MQSGPRNKAGVTVGGSALPSPGKWRAGESGSRPGQPAPKTKRGPAFPPAPRCRHPLACPSGRRARCGGGRHGSTYRQGTWNPAVQRSRSVRWSVTGTGAVPKSRSPASMSLRSHPALRHSGIAVRSSIGTIPEGRFARSPRVGPITRRLQVPPRLWLHLPGLARRQCRSAATRSTRSEDGLCVRTSGLVPPPEGIGPVPSACHPRH